MAAPTIDNAGYGCGDGYCIWLIGQNLNANQSVETYTADGLTLLNTYGPTNHTFSSGNSMTLGLTTCQERTLFQSTGLKIDILDSAAGRSAKYFIQTVTSIPPCATPSPSPTPTPTPGGSPTPPPLATQGPYGGVNIPFLIANYLGMASGSDGSPNYNALVKQMAKKSIRDAKYAGIKLVRTSASAWGPIFYNSTDNIVLAVWRDNPAAYWAAMDEMMADLQAAGIRAVINLVWCSNAFAALTGGTMSDLYTNPNSTAAQQQMLFVSQVVQRYKNHPVVLMWEMHNEMNLGADLDQVSRCPNDWATYIHSPADQNKFCGNVRNYTSDQMISYGSWFAQSVRALDSLHKITSGHAINRGSAEHLRSSPEFSQQGPNWTKDSYSEFAKNTADIHTGFDVISVHVYNGDDTTSASRAFVTTNDVLSTSFMTYVKQASDAAGKELYVGEYFDAGTPAAQWSQYPFTNAMLNFFSSANVPYHTAWVWEFYQFNTVDHQSQGGLNFTMEPGFTDALINSLRNLNINKGQAVYAPPSPDTVTPESLISWPISGMNVTDSRVQANPFVNVLANDDRPGSVTVQIYCNGTLAGTATQAPYRLNISQLPLNTGSNTITARVVDQAGNSMDSIITLLK